MRIRDVVGAYFGASMQNMSYPAYCNYLNEGGKITARSLMDVQALILTFLEEQEAKNEQNELNFQEIKGILAKLVDEKVVNTGEEKLQAPIADMSPPIITHDAPLDLDTFAETPTDATPSVFVCPTCGKEFKSSLGLMGHARSHKKP